LLFLAAVPMIASAEEPQLREKVEHYEIAGTNARQLRDAMDRFGPIANGGERFDARTDWRVGRVMARLREIPPQPTCTDLQEVIELATAGVLAEYRAREVTYDRQTEHGKSQGAIFP
jgi:predicted secreted Zn-dependent protease